MNLLNIIINNFKGNNMKKLLIFLMTLFCLTTVAFSDNFDLYNQVMANYKEAYTNSNYMTDEMWIQYAHEYAATNKIIFETTKTYIPVDQKLLFKISNISVKNKENKYALIDEIDQEFAESGLFISYLKTDFKKIAKNFLIKYPEYAKECPVDTACFQKYQRCEEIPLISSINIFAEQCANGKINQRSIQSTITGCSKNLIKPIKRYLREHGKSFVTSNDGVNPVQEIINEFINAMQAPNHSGLKEFAQTYFPNETWIDINYLSDEKINKLKGDIFYGEIDLTARNAVILQTALGIDEYNKFIKQYNGIENLTTEK